MKSIFSVNGETFLKDQMNIDVDDLTNKILNDVPNSISLFQSLIDFISTITLPYTYTSEMGSFNNIKNEDFINKELSRFYEKYKITDTVAEYNLFDSVRHAFLLYSSGGIYDLFKHRETEEWYPKVIIRKNIGSREDIDVLNDKITVYRGTSKDEYESCQFSQSWTTDKGIANDFAFYRYVGLPKYANTLRALVEAKINKKDIYLFSQNDYEKEVILDERKLIKSSIKPIRVKLLRGRE